MKITGDDIGLSPFFVSDRQKQIIWQRKEYR